MGAPAFSRVSRLIGVALENALTLRCNLASTRFNIIFNILFFLYFLYHTGQQQRALQVRHNWAEIRVLGHQDRFARVKVLISIFGEAVIRLCWGPLVEIRRDGVSGVKRPLVLK